MRQKADSTLTLAALFLVLFAPSCAYSVHQYYAGDFEKAASKGRIITADSEQFVILSITGNTDYVEQAYHRLLDQCPKGRIVGVNTRYSTSMGFLSYTNKIHIQAICI